MYTIHNVVYVEWGFRSLKTLDGSEAYHTLMCLMEELGENQS